MKKIGEMMFNDLPTTVVMSESIRPKYLQEGRELPRKYDNHYYDYIDGYLCDLSNNERVILNAKEVGNQKIINIAGQRVHELAYSNNPGARSKIIKIKNCLKDYFTANIPKLDIKNYPINIEFKFYIKDEGLATQDRDNLALLYEKIFFDCIKLQRVDKNRKTIINLNGFLPDDSIKFINGSTTKAFFTTRDSYLIVSFYEYDNMQEYNNDKANVKLEKKLLDGVQRLSEKYADLSLKSKQAEIRRKNLEEEWTDSEREFWQKEYDFYFETLSNEFL